MDDQVKQYDDAKVEAEESAEYILSFVLLVLAIALILGGLHSGVKREEHRKTIEVERSLSVPVQMMPKKYLGMVKTQSQQDRLSKPNRPMATIYTT